jgi:hypothetical protein
MHIGLAIMFRSYMPGLITAILLTLPIAIVTLSNARRDRWISTRALWSVIPAAVVMHGPVLAAFLIATTRFARLFVRD